MPETAKILCFKCRKEGRHFYQPIIFKGDGFYTCDPVAEEHK